MAAPRAGRMGGFSLTPRSRARRPRFGCPRDAPARPRRPTTSASWAAPHSAADQLLSVTCRPAGLPSAAASGPSHATRLLLGHRRGSSDVRPREPPRALCHTLRRRRPSGSRQRAFVPSRPRLRVPSAAAVLGPESYDLVISGTLSVPTYLSANTRHFTDTDYSTVQ